MKHFPLSVSLIVIGYNTKISLKSLLISINRLALPAPTVPLEVLYIDDGSKDGSLEFFNNFKLKFKKRGCGFDSNVGRVAVTNRGVVLANNTWFWFVRSNITLDKNALIEFVNSINAFAALAFMGKIVYSSADLVFEKYLNNKKRGINCYTHNDYIHYKNLLFGNSIIHCSVFNKIKLNHKLIKYGGEELDFSFLFNQSFPMSMRACSLSVVFRNNHPRLEEHLVRLTEFGKYNVQFLNNENKALLFGVFYFFISLSFLRGFFVCCISLMRILYKFDLPFINYYIIRFSLLCAVLRGYMVRSK